jgi:hypothetical protein
MMLQPGIVDDLRAADTVAQTMQILDATERELLEE